MNEYNKIEEDILKSFFNIRKKILIDKEYSQIIRDGWRKGNTQSKLILKSVAKPKLLNKLFFLSADDQFWQDVSEDCIGTKIFKLGLYPHDRKQFIDLIYIINGLNVYERVGEFVKTGSILDEVVRRTLINLGNMEYKLLHFKKISYKSIHVTEEGISSLRQPLLSLLKEATEYIEAISIIWKWNSIKDKNDIEEYAINNFTMHGLQKIIRNKPQSIRNLFGDLANKKGSQGKIDKNETLIHSFIKSKKQIEQLENFISDPSANNPPTNIPTLVTKEINNFLEEEGYATSINWSHLANSELATKVIELKTSAKRDFNELIKQTGFDSQKLKIIMFGEYAHEVLLPRIRKEFESKQPIDKERPYGYLLSDANFFWPNDSETKIYESLHKLSKFNKFTINKRFLDVRADIKKYGLDKFYSEYGDQKYDQHSENELRSRSTRIPRYFVEPILGYPEINDFKSVLEEIDNIESELYNLDHLVISCPARSGKKLPYINNLISIIKSLDQSNKTIITCVIIDDVPYFEEDLPKEWKEENEEFIEQIKRECDSFIRFDRQKFIESREGDIEVVEAQMRGHKGSFYMKKIERLIDDEIIDIFNNMLVTYCSLPFDDYRHFMEAGATIIGKYDVYWDNYNKVNIEDEIEKKYDYLINDSYNQGREYNSYGRLMMTSSRVEIDGNTKKILDEAKIFRQDTTELFVERGAFLDDEDICYTLTFIQT